LFVHQNWTVTLQWSVSLSLISSCLFLLFFSLSFVDDLIDLNMVLLDEYAPILYESKNCYWIFPCSRYPMISCPLRSCPLIAQSQSFTKTFTTIQLSSTMSLKFPYSGVTGSGLSPIKMLFFFCVCVFLLAALIQQCLIHHLIQLHDSSASEKGCDTGGPAAAIWCSERSMKTWRTSSSMTHDAFLSLQMTGYSSKQN